jgi:hypothetical protein
MKMTNFAAELSQVIAAIAGPDHRSRSPRKVQRAAKRGGVQWWVSSAATEAVAAEPQVHPNATLCMSRLSSVTPRSEDEAFLAEVANE